MTKTLDDLWSVMIKSLAHYYRLAAEARMSTEMAINSSAMVNDQRAADDAWNAYDRAAEAYLDALDAAKLKPCESATTPAPPPPLPR